MCHTHINLGACIVLVVSPPSRVLPQRVWTAAVPTLLSHDGLMRLLAENSLSGYNLESPLERFLSLVLLRRHMQRIVQGDAMVRAHEDTLLLYLSQRLAHSSSLRRLACEATARVLHLARPAAAAALGVMSRLSPLILMSFSTVRCHVSFVRPLFLLR